MTSKTTASSAALAEHAVARAPKAAKRAAPTAAKAKPVAKRKPAVKKLDVEADLSDLDPSLDLEDDVDDVAAIVKPDDAAATAKVKPLRVKVPKSKERALIREF